MKKLILRLALLVLLFVIVVLMTFAALIFVYRGKFDAILKPTADQDILFVGSSQIGCSIVESPGYHNKILWTADRPMQSVAVCVRYMEERGFLDHVRVMCVRVNRSSIIAETSEKLAAAWFCELPMSWRHGADYSISIGERMKYLMTHLAFPIKWQVLAGRATGRLSVTRQTQEWRDNLLSQMEKEGRDFKGLIPNWREETLNAYRAIQSVCRRKGIRLIGIDFPYLESARHTVGEKQRQETASFVADVKGLGIEVLEFPKTFSDDCFFDMVHMTEAGAESFTHKFYESARLGEKGLR